MVEASHDIARDLYRQFLPPPDFRGLAAPYEMRHYLGQPETLRAWDAARVWAPRDNEAREAMHNAEQHLRRQRPIAMAQYDERRLAGAEPDAAMWAVLPELWVHDAGPVAKASLEARVMTPAEADAYLAEDVPMTVELGVATSR